MANFDGDTVSKVAATIADLIRDANTFLGLPGFVLSIVLVVVIGLLIGFRWKALPPTFQFVLIMMVVTSVFGLALIVVWRDRGPSGQTTTVIPTAPTPPTGHPGLLSISNGTSREYFTTNFGEPIKSFIGEADVRLFEGVGKSNQRLINRLVRTSEMIAQGHSLNDFWLGFIGVKDKKNLWQPAGYGVTFKMRDIGEYYLTDLARIFGADAKMLRASEVMMRAEEVALRYRAENAGLEPGATISQVREHAKAKRVDAPPRVVFVDTLRKIVAIRNHEDLPPHRYSETQVVIFYSLLSVGEEGNLCQIGQTLETFRFYSLKEIERCKLHIGPALGFGKLFPGYLEADNSIWHFDLSFVMIVILNMLEIAGFEPTQQ